MVRIFTNPVSQFVYQLLIFFEMKNSLLLLAILAIWSCQNRPSGNSEGMAKFVNDKNFQAAHETPAPLVFEAKGEMISFPTSDGKTGSAYELKPTAPTNKAILVIHEWWGLNDYVKQESQRLFDSLKTVRVLALDLYDGKVATTREAAGEYMKSVTNERAEAIIRGAMKHAGDNARFATIGWCFGGGWSLRTSILAGDRAIGCIMYYGMPVQTAAELAPLKAEVLGIFAQRDGWITPEVAQNFEALAKATGKKVTIQQYDADHAFANPSSPRYNDQAAREANQAALAFLRGKMMD